MLSIIRTRISSTKHRVVLPLRPRQLLRSQLGPRDDEAPRPAREVRNQGLSRRRLHPFLLLPLLLPRAAGEGTRRPG